MKIARSYEYEGRPADPALMLRLGRNAPRLGARLRDPHHAPGREGLHDHRPLGLPGRALTERTERVRCEANVVHVGSVGTAEAKLVDARGNLYSHGKATCLILTPR